MRADRRLVLGSASERRRELLERIGVEFEVVPADIDETPRDGEAAVDYVRRLSAEKAATVAALVDADCLVIGADTTVDVDGRILGKPVDIDEARSMLTDLLGRTHQVHTGVSVIRAGRCVTGSATTNVTFVASDPALVEWYLGLGEPFGKAGGYGIQGAGALLVDRVDGSVTNVIGLPLPLLADLLRQHGATLLRGR